MGETLNKILGYDYDNQDLWFRRFWDNISGRTSTKLTEYNINLQKENEEYQRLLNDKQMEREDTAYQRAVRDANAAGLSSLSVGSGNSSSALSSGETPQINDFASDSFNKGMNMLNSIIQFQNNITQQILSKKRAEADINKTYAETRDIEAKTDLFNYTLSGTKDIFDKEYADKLRKYQFNENYGVFEGADPYEKYTLLNNLSKTSYSDIIQANQFDKIGMIYGILQKIGSKASNGDISSLDDLMDKAGNLLDSTYISNNKVELPFIKLPELKKENTINSIIPEVAPKIMTLKEKREQKKKQKEYNKKHKF